MKKNTPTLDRLYELVEDLFSANGIELARISIQPTQGYWRREDVYRWEGSGTNALTGAPVTFASWDKMAECVNKGIKFRRRAPHQPNWDYEIEPK